MTRVPIGATVVVALAVVAMVALGVWQLDRRGQKLALLDLYAANQHRPPVALTGVPDDRLLFRRVTATCTAPSGWTREAGRAADGSSGWRAIVRCGDGSGLAVQLGVGADALHTPAWAGGAIGGYLTHAPQHRALIAGLFSAAPKDMMLVADAPLPGLKPNPPANLADVPNNHLAYAVQWFAFAAIAAIIYAVALARRWRDAAAPGRPRAVVSAPTRG